MTIFNGKSANGSDVIGLGLTHENIARLLKGEPIHVTRHTHGDGVPEGYEFFILAGPTEEIMGKWIREENPDIPQFVQPRGVKDHTKD